jgi:hypothetical protein
VERRDLIRRLALVLAVAAVVPATAAAAAGATGVRWSLLETGTTTPSGAQQPSGYVAVAKAQERRFSGRLEPADRAALGRLNLQLTGVVAVFLDGLPCSSKLTVNHVVRTATTVTVTLHYTRPPIGVATCVRTSTPYVIVGVSRKSFGHPAPTNVRVVAVART